MEEDSQPKSWQSTIQEIGTPLINTTFVVLDLETTGGAPHLGAGITEIGAVKVCGGRVIAEFQSFVNPGHSIPSYITELTGITDSMVFDAPSMSSVIPSLLEFLGPESENIFVAQNAPFDLSFLKFALRENGYAWPSYGVVDTATLARRVLSRDEAPNCKLGTLAQIFGTTTTPNHRALEDARATVDVLHGLIERLGGFGVYTLEELQSYGKKIKKKFPDQKSAD